MRPAIILTGCRQFLQPGLRCEDAKHARFCGALGQLEQGLVLGYQHRRLRIPRQLKEFLVVAVAADRQGSRASRSGAHLHEPVEFGVGGLPLVVCQRQVRVVQNIEPLPQAVGAGQPRYPAAVAQAAPGRPGRATAPN
mgnify:CR=1 FL=1